MEDDNGVMNKECILAGWPLPVTFMNLQEGGRGVVPTS